MEDLLKAAVEKLTEKLAGSGFEGLAKFAIEGLGVIRVDGESVSTDDGDADMTINLDAETMQSILTGDLDPTSAFMTGKLSVDGDMGLAMKIAQAIAS